MFDQPPAKRRSEGLGGGGGMTRRSCLNASSACSPELGTRSQQDSPQAEVSVFGRLNRLIPMVLMPRDLQSQLNNKLDYI